jgi:hypothetical protein
VGTVPAQGDPGEQAAFLDEALLPRLEEAKRGRRAGLFVDPADFVFGPLLGYRWCLVRRFVPGPSGRTRSNVLAALDAVTHRVIRVANHADSNAESVGALLRQGAAAGLARPVPRVPDNARSRKCAAAQARAASLRIELLDLPSYAPNLNLIERLGEVRQEGVPGVPRAAHRRGVHASHRRVPGRPQHAPPASDEVPVEPRVPTV